MGLTKLPTPANLPAFPFVLDDLGAPTAEAIARALDVHPSTVRRWIARNEAPRPVMLALFYLTRWGRSHVNAEAEQAARLHAGLATSRQREIERLRAELARVVSMADFGSANDPTLDLPAPLAVDPLPKAG